ncbi:MAG: type II secretion system GspH family protein [Planctomycetes bacterium]|nr:type II secretion system GspH family protein [Planctomycetota bacterium]
MSKAATSFRGRSGYTLVEMMVTLMICSMLALALGGLVQGAMDLWKGVEVTREVTDSGMGVMRIIEDDLGSIYCRNTDDQIGDNVRFIADLVYLGPDDDLRRYPRIRFIRTLPGGEEASLATLNAGAIPLSNGDAGDYLLGIKDAGCVTDVPDPITGKDREASTIRPLGGLMEVCYMMGPEHETTTLWRGIRSPIYLGTPTPAGEAPSFMELAPYEPLDPAIPWASVMSSLSSNVIHFGVDIWVDVGGGDGYFSDLVSHPALKDPSGRALEFWDSAEVIDDPAHPGDPAYQRRRGYPDKVRIMVVVVPRGMSTRTTDLGSDVAADDEELELFDSTGFPSPPRNQLKFVKVDDEWIGYGAVEGYNLTGLVRGARGTIPAEHSEGAIVEPDPVRPADIVGTRLLDDLSVDDTYDLPNGITWPFDEDDRDRLRRLSGPGLDVERGEVLPEGGTEHSAIRVGSEWIWYAWRNGSSLYGLVRGYNDTIPRSHRAGETVLTGTLFQKVFHFNTNGVAR